MAEGILRSMLPAERSDVVVGSAGTAGIEGMPATPEAAEVAIEHGADISAHRSRGLDAQTAEEADVILALAEHHVGSILGVASGLRTKTYLLSEFADGTQNDVPDPIGAPKEDYEKVFDMIEGYLRESLDRILMLADRKAGASSRREKS